MKKTGAFSIQCVTFFLTVLSIAACKPLSTPVPTAQTILEATSQAALQQATPQETAVIESVSTEPVLPDPTPAVTETPVNPIQSLPTPPPCTDLGQSWASPIDGMNLQCVPPGSFRMGASASQAEDAWKFCERCGEPEFFAADQPLHIIQLSAYWIDETEVTVAQYQQFVNATRYQTQAEAATAGAYTFQSGQYVLTENADWRMPLGDGAAAAPDLPVTQVTRADAAAYCAWAGRTLPSEAQWERAARGDTASNFPWGDDTTFQMRLNLREQNDGFEHTAPVGIFPDGSSYYFTLDMGGNVAEWVVDVFDPAYYQRSDPVDPFGPVLSSDIGVVRGGSWADTPEAALSWHRQAVPMGLAADSIGFRCALPESMYAESTALYDPCEQVIPAYEGMEITQTESGNAALLVPQGIGFAYSTSPDGGLNVMLVNALVPFLQTELTLGAGGMVLPAAEGGLLIALPPASTVLHNEATSTYTLYLSDGICTENPYLASPVTVETLTTVDELPTILTLNSLIDLQIDESDGSIDLNFDYDSELDTGAIEDAISGAGRGLTLSTEQLRANRITFHLQLPPGSVVQVLNAVRGIVRIILP